MSDDLLTKIMTILGDPNEAWKVNQYDVLEHAKSGLCVCVDSQAAGLSYPSRLWAKGRQRKKLIKAFERCKENIVWRTIKDNGGDDAESK